MVSILLIRGILATMKDENDIIPESFIYIENGKIVDYGKYDKMPEEYKMAELVINAKGKLIIPALTAPYVNFDFYPLRFKCYAKDPKEWYEEIELKYMKNYKDRLSEYSLYLTLYNLMKQGIATICGTVKTLQISLSRIEKLGLNVVLAKSIEKPISKDEINEINQLNKELRRRTQGRSSITLAIANKMILNDEILSSLLSSLKEEPLENKLIIEIAKVKDEISYYKLKYQKRPIEYLESIGLLTEETILTHCTWITLREIKLMLKHGTKAILCPETSLALNEGIPPIMDIVSNNLYYSLGLDKGPSYNILNVIEEVLTIHHVLYGSSRTLKPYSLLERITKFPREILGIEDTGIIEKGYRANITVFNVEYKDAWVYSLSDIYDLLVYGRPNVETLIANGEILLDGGQQLVFSDTEIEEYSEKIKDALYSTM